MFLLCWQGCEIKQADQSSGPGRLQRSASVVSIWSCGDKAPCLVVCCFFSSLTSHTQTHTHKTLTYGKEEVSALMVTFE